MKKLAWKKNHLNKAKTIVTLVSLVLLMTLGLSARAEDPDYGNDCSSAEPLDPNGSVVEGRLSDTSDHDWFSFTAAADGLYEMTFLSQPDCKYMYVYSAPDGCGGQLQQIVYLGICTGTITQEVFIEHPGTYYIEVFSGSGLYRLSVNELAAYTADAYSNTCDNPVTIVVNDPCGPLYDGITDLGMDEDWFTFTTSVLHKYQVSFYLPLNTDVSYDLYSSDCGAHLYGLSQGSTTFVSLDGADYDLRVRSGSFNKEGYYEIWVEDLGEVQDDYNNSCDGATPINTIGDYVEGRLQYQATLFSDEDWFSFTAAADGLYEMTFLSQPGCKYMYVYIAPDGCGGQLQQIVYLGACTGTTTQEVFIEHPGTYYIKVCSGSGLYRLSVNELATYTADAYSNTCDNPATIVVDDPCGPLYDGITDLGMDEDWFTFTTSVLHKYQVSFYLPLNTDVGYDLYSSDCGAHLYGLPQDSTTFVSLDGADYDLRVRSGSFNKEGYYEIWVEDLGEVQDDYGNTCDTAEPVATNGVEVEGKLQYQSTLFSDEDWFSFTAAADGLYEMTFLSQPDCKYMYVYSAPDGCDGQLQQIEYLGICTGTITQEVLIEHPGTYYIKVFSGSGLYRLSVLSPEPQCGDPAHPYPSGDINQDCVVDLVDFAMFADNWLKDNRP